MSSSLLSGLYARPELFREGQTVYLRNPKEEDNNDSRDALANLVEQIGRGPFRILKLTVTPFSKSAPQRITLANKGSGTSLVTEDGPLELSGYYLSSDLR